MQKRKKPASKKILVIDDENDLRRFSVWALEAEGYFVLQAADGITGIKIARQEHPDLILLDIRLPDRSGWTILEEIRNSPQLSDIPVVIFTASADAVFKGLANDMGASDYLIKPVSVEKLRESVQQVLNGRHIPQHD
jgi:two-component system cell cycle response regulator DivK